jgi:hypothetical protein
MDVLVNILGYLNDEVTAFGTVLYCYALLAFQGRSVAVAEFRLSTGTSSREWK